MVRYLFYTIGDLTYQSPLVYIPSSLTMALGLTQPVKEMSTRFFSLGGKVSRCVGLTTYHLHVPIVLKSWKSQPPGTLMACPGL